MASGLRLWCVALVVALWVVSGAIEVRAQTEAQVSRDSLHSWKAGLVARLSGSQAGYSNWTKGGVNSLSVTSDIDWDLSRRSSAWLQEHSVRLAFGLIKQDTLEVRKAHDQIEHSSSLQYRGEGFFRLFNPTIALETRTQFAEGLNYKTNPFEDGRTPPVKVSDFLSPATFTQTLGLSYDPTDWFIQRFGLAVKQTFVLIERFRSLYGVPSSNPIFLEMGLESRTRFDRNLVENVRLRSTLGLFAAFNSSDLPDLSWENRVAMKVNSWLGVDLAVDLLYDRDISRALQVKEVFSLGVALVLL